MYSRQQATWTQEDVKRIILGVHISFPCAFVHIQSAAIEVPEGHALLDLSLGPSEKAGPLRKALYNADACLHKHILCLMLGRKSC